MSQLSRGISKGILAAAAVTLGAAQFASGRDLSVGSQDTAVAAEATINRSAKADRVARTAAASQTQTIALRLDALSATSVLIRIPLVQKARDGASARPVAKSPDRKMTVACEPVVSVLTEVARQLQPGRCVT